VFESWALLADDDPEILQMKQLLRGMRAVSASGVSSDRDDGLPEIGQVSRR